MCCCSSKQLHYWHFWPFVYPSPVSSIALVLGVVPELCLCRDLELDCDGAHLQDIPVVAMNVTMMWVENNPCFSSILSNSSNVQKDSHQQRLLSQLARIFVADICHFKHHLPLWIPVIATTWKVKSENYCLRHGTQRTQICWTILWEQRWW